MYAVSGYGSYAAMRIGAKLCKESIRLSGATQSGTLQLSVLTKWTEYIQKRVKQVEFMKAFIELIAYGVETAPLLTAGLVLGFGILFAYVYALMTWRNV
jgi:hypothetical protein